MVKKATIKKIDDLLEAIVSNSNTTDIKFTNGELEQHGNLITKIKAVRSKLISHNTKVSELFNTALDPIVTITSKGLIDSCNPAFTTMFGYQANEVLGKNVKMLMPEPFHREYDDYLSNYSNARVKKVINISREVIAQRKDGSTFPIHLSISEYHVDNEKFYAGTIRDLTSTKQKEALLESQKIKPREFINTALDPIIIITSKGLIDSCNPAFTTMFGYLADEVVGKNVKLLMPEPYHSEHDGYLSNFTNTGVKKVIGIGREVVAQHKDGSTFPIHLSVSQYQVGDENYFTGTIRDLSKAKAAEARLKEQENKTRELINSALDPIVTINSKGLIDSCNPAFTTMFGYLADEVVGKNVKLLMPEPYHSEHDGYLSNFTNTGVKKVIGIGREVVAQHKNGSTFPIHLSVSQYQIGNEKFYTGTIRNLTKAKAAEAAEARLKEQENKTRELINTALDPIVTINSKGLIDSCNPAFTNMFGYLADEVVGKNVKLLMPEPYHSEHDGYLSNFTNTGVKKVIGIGREVVAQHKDGSTFPIHLSVSQYQIGSEKFYTGTIRDLTLVKEKQAYLEELVIKADRISTGDYSEDIKPRNKQDKLGIALQRMTEILRNVAQVAERLSEGNTSVKVKIQGENDLLAKSINMMVNTLNTAAQQADSISIGNYTSDITPRSEQDKFGIALQRMTVVLRNISLVAEKLAEGDYSISVTEQGDSDLLAQSINKMVTQLRSSQAENSRQIWVSSGLGGLSDAIRGITDLRKMANIVCQYLARYLDVQILTFYAFDEQRLQLVGSYAFNKRKKLGDIIEIGEGLVGQAALEQQTISVTDIPQDYTRIHSSIGEAYPRNIVVTPFVNDGVLHGVLELGSFKELNDDKLALLDSIKESIAVIIRSIFEQTKTQRLLEETQRQTGELQTQQEELKATNENLEEQTQRLKGSEEELKTQSEELKASNEELLEKSRALTIQKQDVERSRQNLEIKSKDLAMASKYKSEFLANMSHELRTPLNSFLLLSKGLAENNKGNLDDEQLEDLKVIYEGGSDLLHLINDIMDLSKVEAGKMTIHIEPVELELICTNIRSLFKPHAKNKALEFNIIREPQVPVIINTDAQRLEQILKNFLSNAFKFTSSGSVQLKIQRPAATTQYQNPLLNNQNSIAFSVIDTGIGIAVHKQKEIFEAFQQEDGSTSRQYGGTGLGLTISRELANFLGGEIQLHSDPGSGSTFTLYLPLNGVESGDTKSLTSFNNDSDSASDQSSFERTAKMPITDAESFIPDDRVHIVKTDKVMLIIEDDENFAKVLLKIVRKQGYKGLVAGDGKNGLYLALEFQPVGIFLDLGLPDMHGNTVLEQLKFHLQTKHIPVHVLSGREQDLDSLHKGAMGFLSKPVTAADINQVITEMQLFTLAEIKTALIVEDSKTNLHAISRLIKNRGIEVECVNTGEAALEKIMTNQFDCVILDLGLPDISGFDVLEKLSNNTDITMPSIIVYTGQELDLEQRELLQKHAATLVPKDADSLENFLDEALLFMHRLKVEMTSKNKNVMYSIDDERKILQKRKILLVDDDVRNTFALSKRLQETGLIVYVADNGRTALKKLEEHDDIELIIMDIMMPIMDGYDAMRQIRTSEDYSEVPIIALTAKAMSDDRAKCIEAGASDYLTKPVNYDKLLSMLKVWLFKKE